MQGLYSVKEDLKTAKEKSAWILPGIHENLKLVDVQYNVTKNGNEYLAFNVEDETGAKVGDTEWPIKFNKPVEAMDTKERETFVSILENQKSKVKQIIEVFYTKEQLKDRPYIIECNTFKEFAEKTIAFLGDSYKDQSIRLKVVFDKKGYTTFGQNANHVFIENMNVASEDSAIRIQPSDKLVRPASPDEKKRETNPFGEVSTEENKEESPF